MRRLSAKEAAWGAAAAAALAIAGGYGINYGMARRDLERKAVAITGGDPARGEALVTRYGCGGCHSIPGVAQATARVGPPLRGFATRVYIAGRLENRPSNLVKWIANPRAVDPGTAMPALGVTPAQARDLAAFLYTLD